MVKYFLFIDTQVVYSVIPKYHYLLEIINDRETTDDKVNEAIELIIEKCKVKLFVEVAERIQ